MVVSTKVWKIVTEARVEQDARCEMRNALKKGEELSRTAINDAKAAGMMR